MTHRYVARQVIVDRLGKPYAYELLYRNSASNFYPSGVPSDVATKDMIATLSIDFDTAELTKGLPAFVNFPKEVLLSEAVSYLDPKAYIIDVLEDVNVDTEVAERMHELAKLGYKFAIDNYNGDRDISPVEDILSAVKVDLEVVSQETQTKILKNQGTKGPVLAKRVENEAAFQKALSQGYQLFQGYHFARPTLIVREHIAFSHSTVMALLKETRQEEVDFDRIDAVIHSDPGLTFRLLRRGNTAQFAGKTKFTNATQVVVRMGIEELQKWGTLMLMQETAEEGQEETMELALLRGLFLEKLTMHLRPETDRKERYYLYLLGLFSIFPGDLRDQLFSTLDFGTSEEVVELGEGLLDFIYAYEMGHHDLVEEYMLKYTIDDPTLIACYKASITEAQAALL